MAYNDGNTMLVDMDATVDEVRTFFQRNAKATSEAVVKVVADALKEALDNKLTGMTDYLADIVQEHATEPDEPSLAVVKKAVENNGWTAQDVGAEIELEEIDEEEYVYAKGVSLVLNACVSNDGLQDVLQHILEDNDADECAEIIFDTYNTEDLITTLISEHEKQGAASHLSSVGAEVRKKLRDALPAEVELEEVDFILDTYNTEELVTALVDEHKQFGTSSHLSSVSAEVRNKLREALSAIDAEQGVTTPAPVEAQKPSHSNIIDLNALRTSIEAEVRSKVEAEVRTKIMAEVVAFMAKEVR